MKALRGCQCEGSICCLKNMNGGRCEEPEVRAVTRAMPKTMACEDLQKIAAIIKIDHKEKMLTDWRNKITVKEALDEGSAGQP